METLLSLIEHEKAIKHVSCVCENELDVKVNKVEIKKRSDFKLTKQNHLFKLTLLSLSNFS